KRFTWGSCFDDSPGGRLTLVFMVSNSKDSALAKPASSDRPVPRRGASAATPESAPTGMDPWVLWVTFRRTWFWAIPLGLLLATPVIIVVYKDFVPEYRATHLLEANRDYVVFQGVLSRPSE